MPQSPPSPLALALAYLRTAAGWTQAKLALALGFADDKGISAYERGAKALTRENLESLVAPLGYPPEAIDVFLFAHALIQPEPQEEAPSPVSLSREERLEIHRSVMGAGWNAGQIEAGRVRAELMRQRTAEKIEDARQEAVKLFQYLSRFSPEERRGLVEPFPDYWSWALAVRFCEASVKRAAHRPDEALELAELAVVIAERVPGEEGWRSRLLGYCWAHVANARRVANDLTGADEGFARAWSLWRHGDFDETGLLGEWVLPSMESSLRRDQRRFLEALELLDRAKAARGGSRPEALVLLLLQEEHIFEEAGDLERALAALATVAPLIEASGNPRHIFSFRFKSVNHLSRLERYDEAAKLLPQVRDLADQLANEMDLLRVVWLESKVVAGQGSTEEAITGLKQVSRGFRDRRLPYNAALSSLDLSVLCLRAGRTAEVRELAVAMRGVFKAKGIAREALAALKVFCEAAIQEIATVELAQRTIEQIELARRSAPPHVNGRDRA